MITPAWVITGFLDSGKTTLINRLTKEELKEQELLVIQFENGDVPLKESEQIRHLSYTKSQLEETPYEISEMICQELEENPVDLVLIEWNGMEHFHTLEQMFLQFRAKAAISIEKVIYTAAGEELDRRIADSGAISMSQVAASDCAYVRTDGNVKIKGDKRVGLSVRADLPVFTDGQWNRFTRNLFRYDLKTQLWLLLVSAAAVLFLVVKPALGPLSFSLDVFLTVFLGVFLQAIPFLAIGVLLSSAIQVYISPDWIQHKFPKKVIPAQLFAVFVGFCLPVCDCASIPVFKSLVKKGVPLSAAVTFMLVSPVINPVVILSTWYAFNGNVTMIGARCGLGILCAVLTGITYLLFPPKKVFAEGMLTGKAEDWEDDTLLSGNSKHTSRFFQFMRHAQNEFFSVGKYLLTGIFVSTLFQQFQPAMVRSGAGIPLAASILFLMAMAFALSLCSSSDAVVARTMAGIFPQGAIMGFLVFGPMMDIKNVAMLLYGFRKIFILRLMATVFVICFTAVYLFAALNSGGIR
ncbi:permease [Lacrimispora sp. JR3]|uniref:permease n=1 Tax=Lacrimispora sinapis TaxID=3111456 RepID=UPI00374A3AA8